MFKTVFCCFVCVLSPLTTLEDKSAAHFFKIQNNSDFYKLDKCQHGNTVANNGESVEQEKT